MTYVSFLVVKNFKYIIPFYMVYIKLCAIRIFCKLKKYIADKIEGCFFFSEFFSLGTLNYKREVKSIDSSQFHV